MTIYKNCYYSRCYICLKLEKAVQETEKKMKRAAKDLDFITAAQYRDEMLALKKMLKDRVI